MLIRFAVFAAVVCAIVCAAPSAHAACGVLHDYVYNVNYADEGDTPAEEAACSNHTIDCTLRAALAVANAQLSCVGSRTINIEVEMLNITTPLVISQPMAIHGAGIDKTMINGQGETSVLTLSGITGAVSIDNLSLVGGYTNTNAGEAIEVGSGNPQVTLDHISVHDNSSDDDAALNFTSGSLTISNCIFARNVLQGRYGGGAIYMGVGVSATITH